MECHAAPGPRGRGRPRHRGAAGALSLGRRLDGGGAPRRPPGQERITEIARGRARIDAILSAMEDGVLAVDHHGSVLLANQALQESLELREPVGRHYLEVVRQREVGELLEGVLRAGARRADEVEMLRGGRAYAVTGVPFPDPEGQPSCAGAAERKGLSLRRSDRGAPTVVSDADRLRQILENLVENAVKYTPAGGRIDITSGPASAGGAELVVADDGPGISAEHLPRIF